MIIAAENADPQVLAALHQGSFARPWSAGEFEELLQNPASFALMARENDAAVGFIMAWAAGGEAEILTLAVSPESRRKGAGAALVAAACAVATNMGAESMVLDVAESNAAARALYGGLGFAEVGRRPGYYEAEGTAIVMRRALPI